MKLKRIVSCALALALTLCLALPCASRAQAVPFPDIADSETADNVEVLRMLGVIDGIGGQFQRMAGDVAACIALRRLGPFEQPFRNQRVERTRQRPAERGIRIGFYWKRGRSGGSGFSAGEGAIQQAVRVVERRTKDLSAGEILPCGGNAPQHAHG